MQASQKQRLKRLEGMLQALRNPQDPTGNPIATPSSNVPRAIKAEWLEKNESGRRRGPPDTVSDVTRRLYETMVLMDEATVPCQELV